MDMIRASVDTCTSRQESKVENKINEKSTQQLGKKKKKKFKEPWQEEWKLSIEKYQQELLDPSYLHKPIRKNTIDAATLYPSAFPEHPGLVPGSHKHLGGAYDPTDGTIYGIPANSKAILVIRLNEDGEYRLTTIPLPKQVADTSMKWLRGIISGGYLWAIPAWADSVLCVDIDAFWKRRPLAEGETDYVKLVPLPKSHPKGMRWQWHGAGINKEQTGIFCVPSNAKHVLKVDCVTKTTSFIAIEFDQDKYPDFSLDCTNKWYGGITGDDNAVYCIPYRASGVLRIDTATNTAKVIGPNYGIGNYFWHGGIKRNGKIYAHPSHADTVLVIDTKEESKGIVSELPIDRKDQDKDKKQTYKWLGGSVGADGNIYCPACDTSAILKINVTTDYCDTQGFTGRSKNKWQGGILGRDACIYTIPADGVHVCRIATDPSIEGDNPVQLLGDLPSHKDKWQGAAVGKDGSLYFIPESGYRVMRVTPPLEPPAIVDGKLPENDVLIELL
ncbi:MAG: hypothetical protein SGILL_002523 [Bacillariaceae sp.]